MRKLCILVTLVIIKISAFGQIEKPVKWSYAAKKINANEAVVYFKATINKGWHVYSLNSKDGGPVKTGFTFKAMPGYKLLGNATEPTPITHFEKSFGMNVSYFENTVIFQQKIKLKTATVTVKGTLEYMACNDKKCLPPEDVDFVIPVK
ncbi:protein-disulfide reductase DsbD domain-containing protein [Mucilaginibacter psychrotolerans]|uniref:Sugar transporter n=1 Tax=Mucilaginibacter psychrotolerans TaxID=1524096 RepID=A0A4Y8SCN8_9SPHI|nr:protein-disulfide reductase DsbD domain-containing protein [Mucilaginibacter psychrotolerans]TFF36385.1 sugar transporter [Mucilaginibacter psychrotolerans]